MFLGELVCGPHTVHAIARTRNWIKLVLQTFPDFIKAWNDVVGGTSTAQRNWSVVVLALMRKQSNVAVQLSLSFLTQFPALKRKTIGQYINEEKDYHNKNDRIH